MNERKAEDNPGTVRIQTADGRTIELVGKIVD